MNRETFWKRHIVAQRSSGLSQSEYCLREKVNASSFSHWSRRLKRAAEPEGRFVAVGGSSELEVRVGQAVIRVPSGSDLGELRRLVEALSC